MESFESKFEAVFLKELQQMQNELGPKLQAQRETCQQKYAGLVAIQRKKEARIRELQSAREPIKESAEFMSTAYTSFESVMALDASSTQSSICEAPQRTLTQTFQGALQVFQAFQHACHSKCPAEDQKCHSNCLEKGRAEVSEYVAAQKAFAIRDFGL